MARELFVMLMENCRPLDSGVIGRHVEHLAMLDAAGQLVLCGPFAEGRGGMVILTADSYPQAEALCRAAPYIAEGYKTYRLMTMQVADKDNGYLLKT